jgi:flagellar biogenesis protein FliO
MKTRFIKSLTPEGGSSDLKSEHFQLFGKKRSIYRVKVGKKLYFLA